MAKDRFKYFRIEAREIVDGMAQGLLDLEKRVDERSESGDGDPTGSAGGAGGNAPRGINAELIARLLRLAHTLKGAARIVGHRELTELAHRMEDVLGPLRDAPAPQRLDAGLAIVDDMAVHVAAMQQSAPAPASPMAARPPQTQMITPLEPPPAPPAVPAPDPPAAPAAPPAAGTPPTPAPRARVLDAPPLRFEPSAVDELLGGIAEVHTLVRRLRGLDQTALPSGSAAGRGQAPAVDDLRTLGPRIDQLERELIGVRQGAERLRLVAAGSAFTALERTARDAAHAAGKRVGFASSGGDVRVDAYVLTTLHGALVQMVRNAVAHGIEAPAQRAAAGKPEEGRVAIAVVLQGSRIAITCQDDGRGIDLEAVRQAAVRRGLDADRARGLAQDQLIELVLRGGLTTSAEVTMISGRGIGLDVVREAAHVLGGEVTVRTGADGTAIRIAVPTSVAAVSALTLGAGDHIVAIPLAAVRRVVRSAAVAILHGPDGLTLALDDITIPFAPLSRLLGATGGTSSHRSIIIVEGNTGLAAVGADHVLGVGDAVVRALPAGAPIDPVVWGVTLDAEGVPRPVLEPNALVAAIRVLPAASSVPAARPLPILVVDDSLTTRMLEQSILESAGYEVELACSAEEGLVKLTQHPFGLILVDVEMPGMDGFGFIATLRSQPSHAEIPAILVTSRNRPEDLRRGVEVGAQGYVVKGDFDQTQLLGMIHRLVRR